MEENYRRLKKINKKLRREIRQRMGGDLNELNINELQALEAKMDSSLLAIRERKSKECLEKVTQTISFLAQPRESHLLLLTGEVQRDRAAELLGLRACNFWPRHSSKLGNEFRVFTNYDPGERLGGWEQE
ncbi:agamous-like MADS-box protein AP3 [Gossypium raimondii]|uniref:agamous-like MADS-box protein AP3 n=1 Tax=Gossypium raimondii TaxID=29730 RepID=UPI00227CC29C|nr:agamous-like MADS-box protein AP3 [Gossypium raimondii]